MLTGRSSASLNLCQSLELSAKLPRFGDLLIRSHACTFQDEVRDVHTPLLGTETDEPRFAFR